MRQRTGVMPARNTTLIKVKVSIHDFKDREENKREDRRHEEREKESDGHETCYSFRTSVTLTLMAPRFPVIWRHEKTRSGFFAINAEQIFI